MALRRVRAVLWPARAAAGCHTPFHSVWSAGVARTLSDAVPVRPGIHRTPIVDKLWSARAARSGKLEVPLTVDESGIVSWPPSHSRMTVDYAFGSNPTLADQYMNPWGKIRKGRVLEDLDAFAGSVALEHCRAADGALPPPTVAIVTASVDRITVAKDMESLDVDMKMTGSVIYTGTSSIVVQMSAQCAGFPRPFIVARFTFVARDLSAKAGSGGTGKAFRVSKLVPQSPEEVSLYRATEQEMSRKKAAKAAVVSEFGVPPEYGGAVQAMLREAQALQKMPCVERGSAGRSPVLLSQTRLSNSMICQPQQRNTNGRVFGGFLMRRAFELAFATAYVFCGSLPRFVEVDEVTFKEPVEIGNLLQLDSCVLFTSETPGPHKLPPHSRLMFVEVVAYVTIPEQKSCKVSNNFHFSFVSDVALPRIVPDSMEAAHRMVNRMIAEGVQAHSSTLSA